MTRNAPSLDLYRIRDALIEQRKASLMSDRKDSGQIAYDLRQVTNACLKVEAICERHGINFPVSEIEHRGIVT